MYDSQEKVSEICKYPVESLWKSLFKQLYLLFMLKFQLKILIKVGLS